MLRGVNAGRIVRCMGLAVVLMLLGAWQKPRASTTPKLPTAEEIDRMSAKDHARWLNDPVHGAAFRAHEDRIEQQRRQRAGR